MMRRIAVIGGLALASASVVGSPNFDEVELPALVTAGSVAYLMILPTSGNAPIYHGATSPLTPPRLVIDLE